MTTDPVTEQIVILGHVASANDCQKRIELLRELEKKKAKGNRVDTISLIPKLNHAPRVVTNSVSYADAT